MNADEGRMRVGFVGAGKMATALAHGLCQSGFTTPDRILASDVSSAAREHFAANSGARALESNVEVVAQSDIVVLAVKPHHFRHVLGELKEHIGPHHLV